MQQEEKIQNDEQEVQDVQDEQKKPLTGKEIIKEIISWIITVAAAVALALFLNNVVLINARIPSGSMENTIMEGDRLIGNRLSYTKSGPKRGDIVIFKWPDDETQNYVKRVIGLPGETIVIADAKVYIDGSETPLAEEYLKEDWTIATGPYTFEVPEGCYFVMGDNRNNSSDARYWKNPYVAEEKILGKAAFRYFPFNAMGKLK